MSCIYASISYKRQNLITTVHTLPLLTIDISTLYSHHTTGTMFASRFETYRYSLTLIHTNYSNNKPV
jgi:hypothetical protein